MSLQREVDIKSNHISQEEVIHKEYCVNQKDLNGHEKMIESITDNQKSTEEVDMKNVNMDNDLKVLASPAECTRNLNGAYMKEGSSGEVDISSGFKNLNLSAALQPDEINLEILNDDHTPGMKVYEVVNEDPETAFSTLANREAFSTDECSIQHCLYQFTRNEKLRDANKLLCEVCTRRQYSGPKANIKGIQILSQKVKLMFRGTFCTVSVEYYCFNCISVWMVSISSLFPKYCVNFFFF